MGGILAGSVCTVVAGNTIAEHIGVIKDGGRPGGAAVAIVTLLTGYDMCRCLTCSLNTVMAGVATATDRSVIDIGDRIPGSSNVAVGALPG